MQPLSDDQLMRYARNILMDCVDVTGQQRLLAAHVAVVGAGGLGAPVLQYLAASGVGTLSIIDDDVVEVTNLQRQVIHPLAQVGNAKVDSAAASIAALNPEVRVITHATRLDDTNVDDLLAPADLVLVGTDNFASRYLINRYCALARKALVSGAAIGTSGQLTSFTFQSDDEPCFQCLYEQGSDEQLTCATAGVLGPVVGAMGSLMAMEAMKLLLDIGEPLVGRLLVWDALTMDWQRFNYQQNPHCPVCLERQPGS